MFFGLLCLHLHINGGTRWLSWRSVSSRGADTVLTVELNGDDVTMVLGCAHICRPLVGHNWVRATAVFRVTGFQREFKGSAKAPGESRRNGGCAQLQKGEGEGEGWGGFVTALTLMDLTGRVCAKWQMLTKRGSAFCQRSQSSGETLISSVSICHSAHFKLGRSRGEIIQGLWRVVVKEGQKKKKRKLD